MANIKFSQLPVTTSLTGATFPVVQAGNNFIASANLVVTKLPNGDISTTGNILTTGGNILSSGRISAAGNINTSGNVIALNAIIQEQAIVTGNVWTFANLSAWGTVSSRANVSAQGNIVTEGFVSATGNILTAANITATGNISSGNVSTVGNIQDTSGLIRNIPINPQTTSYELTVADSGKCISTAFGGIGIPANLLPSGSAVTIFNNSANIQQITQNGGLTLQWAGQGVSRTGNRVLGPYGLATVLYITTNSAVITGAGLD